MKYLKTILILSISLFACTEVHLPSIKIEKEGDFSWTKKEVCNIIYENQKEKVEIGAKIKCRGGMSGKYYKRSYSIELDNKLKIGNMEADDDWILNANYIDKTFMRHKISYDLFKQMSNEHVAANSSYVNVYVNEEYQGLYLIMEEINASMIGLDKSDSMAMLFKDPPIFYKEKLPYYHETIDYYEQKYPKLEKKDRTKYIEGFANFLFQSSDSDFAANITSWIDLESVVDWHLLLLLTNNGDGIMKNFYLYKVNSKTPFRIAIWDYDHSFGRDGDNEINLGKQELKWRHSVLLNRLCQIEATNYIPKLKERWQILRSSNVFTIENIEDHIYKNNALIKHAVVDNFTKWPADDKWYFDDNNYEDEIKLMSEFINKRITILDQYIGELGYH